MNAAMESELTEENGTTERNIRIILSYPYNHCNSLEIYIVGLKAAV
jgi:NADH pyrophosphatase NudC (nudix superfamily)